MKSAEELGKIWQELTSVEAECANDAAKAVEKVVWAKIRQLEALIDLRKVQGSSDRSQEIKRVRREIQLLHYNARIASRFASEAINTSWWRRYIA